MQRELFIEDENGMRIWLYLTTQGNYENILEWKKLLLNQRSKQKELKEKIDNLSDEEASMIEKSHQFDEELPRKVRKGSSTASLVKLNTDDDKTVEKQKNLNKTVKNV